MCLIIIAAAPAWAQNTNRFRNTRQNGCVNCSPLRTHSVVLPLSDEEIEDLKYIRKEEKLARDVYQALYSKWKLRIFNNIAQSEQNHFEAVGSLLERYGVPDDPVEDMDVGGFANEPFITLYDDLLDQGNISLLKALETGVKIEEMDIEDLKAALLKTDHRDIETVYTNLLSGSLNHLSAFESHIEAAGY